MTNIAFLARDRFRLTEQALESLYAHTPQDQFNLTIIDDASEDFRVRRLLAKFGSKANATLLRIETSSHVLARAKNLGAFWSEQTFGRGDWLYFSDNDVYFLPNWLEKLTAVGKLLTGNLLMGGQVHPFHKPITEGFADDGVRYTRHEMLDGPSWLMRWSTWDLFGPLDRSTAPGTCQSEDVNFCNKIVESGQLIFVTHPHVVVHTGLTNSAGQDAPGRKEREGMIPPGVLAE